MSNSIYTEIKIPSTFEKSWTHFKSNSLFMFGLWNGLALLLVILLASYLAPYDAESIVGSALLPPSWNASGSISFFLGTDDLSRDLLSRLILGSRFTVGVSLFIALTSAIVGIYIAIFLANFRSNTLAFVTPLLDAMISIPSLLFAVIAVAYFQPGSVFIFVAIWLALLPRFIRLTYITITQELKKEYVMAARLDGASYRVLISTSIFPNILSVLVAEITRVITITIIEVSALGYLNLGAQSPLPEWGRMILEATDSAYIAPWTITLPGIAITWSILIFNIIGEGLRQSINAGAE